MSKPFFIFIVVAAFVVVAAVAWFSNNQSNLVEDTITNANVNIVNATNSVEGNQNTNNENNSNVSADAYEGTVFTLQQPAEITTNVDITTYTFSADKVLNVMPANMQSVTVAETAVKERAPITIGEVTGERLTVSSAKDGSDQTVVQVVRNGQLYDFRGSADFLDHLTEYIQFN